nr:hypothetical protein [Morchella crassipes]
MDFLVLHAVLVFNRPLPLSPPKLEKKNRGMRRRVWGGGRGGGDASLSWPPSLGGRGAMRDATWVIYTWACMQAYMSTASPPPSHGPLGQERGGGDASLLLRRERRLHEGRPTPFSFPPPRSGGGGGCKGGGGGGGGGGYYLRVVSPFLLAVGGGEGGGKREYGDKGGGVGCLASGRACKLHAGNIILARSGGRESQGQ